MNDYSQRREIEKIKPLKERVGLEANRLVVLREAMRAVLGPEARAVCALDGTIKVLLEAEKVLAGEHARSCELMQLPETEPVRDHRGKTIGRRLIAPKNPLLVKCTCGAAR